jgi:hypothetical protein
MFQAQSTPEIVEIPGQQQVPQKLSIQGRCTDDAGAPRVQMIFRLMQKLNEVICMPVCTKLKPTFQARLVSTDPFLMGAFLHTGQVHFTLINHMRLTLRTSQIDSHPTKEAMTKGIHG